MGLPRQKHWSGLPFPPPGDLPHPGVELESPVSPALQVDSFTTALCGKPSMVGLSKDEKRESVSDPVMPCFLWSCGPWLARLLCPRDSPGQNTGVGCHSRLQGIFPTPGLNLSLLHRRQILYRLSHQGSPNTLPPKRFSPVTLPHTPRSLYLPFCFTFFTPFIAGGTGLMHVVISFFASFPVSSVRTGVCCLICCRIPCAQNIPGMNKWKDVRGVIQQCKNA